MSVEHFGNIQPHLDFEEHDGTLNAKKVSLVSSATIYASVAFGGNVTLNPSPNFIGLVSVAQPIRSNVSLGASEQFIGLVSVAQPLNSLVTIYPRTDYIGLVSVSGNVAFLGNVTLNPSPNFIGLATVRLGAEIPAGTQNIGDIDIASAIPAGTNYIGLVSVAQPINANVSLGASAQFIGLVSIAQPINANVSLGASAQFIGLTTTVPSYRSTYTSLSTVISALATIVVPPSGQKIFLRNLHVSSLGRGEISLWAARGTATLNRVPWTSLSTTSGFAPHYGEDGIQWGAADDSLTVALNGSATIGVMVDVRFAA